MRNRFDQAAIDVVRKPPPVTVEDVVARLDELQIALGGYTDGRPLSGFNFLYHRITSEILTALDIEPPTSDHESWHRREEHPLAGHYEGSLDRLARDPLAPLTPAVLAIEIPETIPSLVAQQAALRQAPMSDDSLPPATEVEIPAEATMGPSEEAASDGRADPHHASLNPRLEDGFADGPFMRILDVEFAALYFSALRAWTNDEPVPTCWEALFENWDNLPEGAMTGALLGINAHINHDLALAVVASHDQVGMTMVDGGDRHDDYLLINDVFLVQIPILFEALKDLLPTSKQYWYQLALLLGLLDHAAPWLIDETRDLAWLHARDLMNGTAPVPPAAPTPIDPTRDGPVGLWAEAILLTPA